MSKENKWWRDYGMGQKVLSVLSENINKQLIIYDTETTGLDPETCRIIQISAIKCEIDENYQFHEISRFNTFINPQHALPKKIIQITGITDDILSKAKIETELWNDIYSFFGNTPIVCGHNVEFDIGMLSAMYKRNGAAFSPTSIDTLTMAKELHRKNETKSHKLGDLSEYFGLNYGLTFHNSMDDVIATMRLLRLFIEEYIERKNSEPVTPNKIQTRIKSCWAWTGYRGMQRLYVKVRHENRIIWINQRRPYEWGEKDKNSLELFDMHDIEQQVLNLYHCSTLEELSKVRDSKYSA